MITFGSSIASASAVGLQRRLEAAFPMSTELPAVPGTYTIGQFYGHAGFDASVVARQPVCDFIMIVKHTSSPQAI